MTSQVNVALCMQGASSPDPSTVFVDARALRHDRVTLVEKGSPHSLPLIESGKLLAGVKVVIANPDTRGQCADSHLGEVGSAFCLMKTAKNIQIWVHSAHNAQGYFSVFGDDAAQMHSDHFAAQLTTGDMKTVYARTGFLGFVRQTQAVTADGGEF